MLGGQAQQGGQQGGHQHCMRPSAGPAAGGSPSSGGRKSVLHCSAVSVRSACRGRAAQH